RDRAAADAVDLDLAARGRAVGRRLQVQLGRLGRALERERDRLALLDVDVPVLRLPTLQLDDELHAAARDLERDGRVARDPVRLRVRAVRGPVDGCLLRRAV